MIDRCKCGSRHAIAAYTCPVTALTSDSVSAYCYHVSLIERFLLDDVRVMAPAATVIRLAGEIHGLFIIQLLCCNSQTASRERSFKNLAGPVSVLADVSMN